jgi:hypothetical protein
MTCAGSRPVRLLGITRPENGEPRAGGRVVSSLRSLLWGVFHLGANGLFIPPLLAVEGLPVAHTDGTLPPQRAEGSRAFVRPLLPEERRSGLLGCLAVATIAVALLCYGLGCTLPVLGQRLAHVRLIARESSSLVTPCIALVAGIGLDGLSFGHLFLSYFLESFPSSTFPTVSGYQASPVSARHDRARQPY